MSTTRAIPAGQVEHGTNKGYMWHWRRDEEPCTPCRIAHIDYMRDSHSKRDKNRTDRRAPRPAPNHPSCGTRKGYRRHLYHDEQACRHCALAETVNSQIRIGNPVSIRTPERLLAELYLNAPIDLQRRLEDEFGAPVIDILVARFDDEAVAS